VLKCLRKRAPRNQARNRAKNLVLSLRNEINKLSGSIEEKYSNRKKSYACASIAYARAWAVMNTGTKIVLGVIVTLALVAIVVISLDKKDGGSTGGIYSEPTTTETTATTTDKFLTACELGNCPFDIYEGDSGKSFTYSATSRVTIFLNETLHPQENLKIDCKPTDAMGKVANVPAVTPPLYPVRLEAVKLGICTVTDKDFAVEIIVTD
jgi:hypothetical protein